MKKAGRTPSSTTEKVNGGTVTTTVTSEGHRHIEIKGVSGYHRGNTYVNGVLASSSAFHQPPPSKSTDKKKQGTQKPSKTGTTFQKIGSLILNSSELKVMQNHHSHTVFANEHAYQAAQQPASSSKTDSSQQTKSSSFKR